MFSGIGCSELAFSRLGWESVAAAETDAFCSEVLALRFPETPNLGDVLKADWAAVEADVVMASPPCPSFSVAGGRAGLSDPRGELLITHLEAVDAADPAVYLFENVLGLLQHADNPFGEFLSRLVGADAPVLPPGGRLWPGAGLVHGPRRKAAWRVLDAQHFGVAQQRRRVFLAALRSGAAGDPSEILFEPEHVPRNSPPGGQAGRGLPSVSDGRRRQGGFWAALAEALAVGKGQGLPAARTLTSQMARSPAGAGNSCAPRAVTAARTLTTKGERLDFKTDNFAVVPLRFKSGRLEIEDGGDSPCMTARYGSGGGNTQNSTAYGLRDDAIRKYTPREWERLMGLPDDWTRTERRSMAGLRNIEAHAEAAGADVRRTWEITAEYEGLSVEDVQKGGVHPDAPRYRAIGNGIAVPVLEWLGRRVRAFIESGGADG